MNREYKLPEVLYKKVNFKFMQKILQKLIMKWVWKSGTKRLLMMQKVLSLLTKCRTKESDMVIK